MIPVEKIKSMESLWVGLCAYLFVVFLNQSMPIIGGIEELTLLHLEEVGVLLNVFLLLSLYAIGDYGLIALVFKCHKMQRNSSERIYESYILDVLAVVVHVIILAYCFHFCLDDFEKLKFVTFWLTLVNIVWLYMKRKHLSNSRFASVLVNCNKVCMKATEYWIFLNVSFIMIYMCLELHEAVIEPVVSLKLVWVLLLLARSVFDLYMGRYYYKMVLMGDFNINTTD